MTADGKQVKRGAFYWSIGVSVYKSELYGWLRQKFNKEKDNIGYIFFPRRDDEYFKQLTAEFMRKRKNKKGHYNYEWVKHRDRNEALDCAIYNRAAAALCGIDTFTDDSWEALEN